jgi:hypothetical protein
MRHQNWKIALVSPLLLVSWGCGGGGSSPSSTQESIVRGVVKVKGKPAARVNVTFDPSNSSRTVGARSTVTESDGSYTIETFAGENKVTVTGPETSKDPAVLGPPKVENLKPGENTIAIDL